MDSETGASGDPVLSDGHLLRRVLAEVRWSFQWPCNWLLGVFLNLGLSLLWLVWVPLRGGSHGDWVILVGTYFAVFILADVTTTNVLGLDATRVRASLASGVSMPRLLLAKNVALLIIVGLPTLAMTVLLTVRSEIPHRLEVTVPGVALPMFAWLGVGNIVSVLMPVAVRSMRTRWSQRRQWRTTLPWLAHLALPYALLYAVDPVGDTPRHIMHLLPRGWHTDGVRGLVNAATGLLIWVAGTLLATEIARRRGVRML